MKYTCYNFHKGGFTIKCNSDHISHHIRNAAWLIYNATHWNHSRSKCLPHTRTHAQGSTFWCVHAKWDSLVVEWVFFYGFTNFSLCLLNKHNIEILSRLCGGAIDKILLPVHTHFHCQAVTIAESSQFCSITCMQSQQTSFHRVIFNWESNTLNSAFCNVSNEWMPSLPQTHKWTMCLLTTNGCKYM